jgi:CRP/FNR family transcriptional regulator, nitrogen oxide reductase regulator
VAADTDCPGVLPLSASSAQISQAFAPLRELVGDDAPESYPAGIELFQQGAVVEGVYVVAEGVVKLSHISLDGRPTILGLRSPGWILGAAAATCSPLHPVSATTLTRCRLHRVPTSRFRALLKRRAKLSWYVHEMHSREIHEHLMQLVGIRSLPARERLGRLFLRLMPSVDEVKGGVRLESPLRLWEVAQLIAVTPSYLSDLLRGLEREGVIRRSKGWVIILDPHRLSSGDP